MQKVIDILEKNIAQGSFIKGTISNMKGDYPYKKINLKPVLIKDTLYVQLEQFKGNQAFHSNVTLEELQELLPTILENFHQYLFLCSDAEYQILKNKKGFAIKEKKVKQHVPVSLEHNKKKHYLLPEDEPIEFLIHLGIMNKNGKVHKESYPKFRQINKYLEFIDDTVREMKEKNLVGDFIKIVDFGCGKSYLTFALYHYLKNIKQMQVEILGLDLKESVIAECNDIAQKLDFKELKFLTGNIKDFDHLKDIDLIFSLHACNNATDYSILKGLELGAKAILAVPCCQSEFNQKISQSKESHLFQELNGIGKHGILLEKFASLATDALRGLALERCGYRTQIMEFIDMEHTPKNILIKSVKDNFKENQLLEKKKEYDSLVDFLKIKPLLSELLEKYFIQ
jgi:SAM-dependent methyltransferase